MNITTLCSRCLFIYLLFHCISSSVYICSSHPLFDSPLRSYLFFFNVWCVWNLPIMASVRLRQLESNWTYATKFLGISRFLLRSGNNGGQFVETWGRFCRHIGNKWLKISRIRAGWLQWGATLRNETKWGERSRIVTVIVYVCCVRFFLCLFLCLFIRDVPGGCSGVKYCVMKRNEVDELELLRLA